MQKLAAKQQDGTLKAVSSGTISDERKRKRWDLASAEAETPQPLQKAAAYDFAEAQTPHMQRWDETPGRPKGSDTPGVTPSASTRMWEATPSYMTPSAATPSQTPGTVTPGRTPAGGGGQTPSARRNRWDETPKTDRETPGHPSGWAETPRTDRGGDTVATESTPTPSASKRKSRWDETPAGGGATPSTPITPAATMTPSGGVTPSGLGGITPGSMTPNSAVGMFTPSGATPVGFKAMGMATPSPAGIVTPEQMYAFRLEKEMDDRNRALTDADLDAMLPDGYKVLPPPANYVPLATPNRRLTATPTPISMLSGATPVGFHMQSEEPTKVGLEQMPAGNLPFLKPDDEQYFGKLLTEVDEESLPIEEQKERRIMKLLLKIKNGTPPMRKSSLRQITDKAREFGAGPLFNQILPLLMSPTLEDQERHLLVKVIDRILYKLDDLVRPYVHKVN